MRAKQSTTVSGIYRHSGSLTMPLPICAEPFLRGQASTAPERGFPVVCAETAQDEGLLHDARNLLGAIGLYCDLLSMADVLKPEHRHYAEELRLLGTRSGALIQRLMEHRMQSAPAQEGLGTGPAWESGAVRSLGLEKVQAAERERPCPSPTPVSLRAIIERCSGLFSQVADGSAIEVSYGAAASVPVPVGEEAVERILVNLVRNSAAAIRGPEPVDGTAGDAAKSAARGTVVERVADGTADDTPGSIRIGVGVLVNRMDDPRPWPLRRVRLTVEDSGCGMSAEQLERILSGYRAPSRGSHGIGFRVVRDLVAATNGDLRVMSAPGIGTRVQIEWPVTAISLKDAVERDSGSRMATVSGPHTGVSEWPGTRRQRDPATQGPRAVETDRSSGGGVDSAAGAGRWTIC
jgi:signal transduction histidine kinase